MIEAALRGEIAELNKKVNYLYGRVEAMKDQGKRDQGKKMVDLKHLNPEKFEGLRGKVKFRVWTQDIKDLAARYSDILLSGMKSAEYHTEPITKDMAESRGIKMEEDTQLRSALRAFTEGRQEVL